MDAKKYREWTKNRRKNPVMCSQLKIFRCNPDETFGKKLNEYCVECFKMDEKKEGE